LKGKIMNKRLPFLCLIVCLAMWLTLPAAPTAAQATSYQEGASLRSHQGHTIAFAQVSLDATKTITHSGGRTSHVSMLQISMSCNHGDTVLSIAPITIPIPGDPDNLEVSRDLGWAGLDTEVSVYDEISASNVTIAIHAYWWANTGVSGSGSLFTRRTRLEGSIVTPKCTFDLSRPNTVINSTFGHTFSTREPHPRYY
jgi:hypothetical protein